MLFNTCYDLAVLQNIIHNDTIGMGKGPVFTGDNRQKNKQPVQVKKML